ncbi:DUF2254 family protein [Paraburkholderia sp. SIMBA_030]|uniref:DUF2254 family protein n=1 Tax=Paraburkholderia sp. SIMBA_030 TaxID=3085773 RepID=UPI00397C0519
MLAPLDERRLRTLVAFGTERTMEQDPMFAFRILVDIALKPLSAAINDLTTAVLAVDQLHRLLRVVGKRSLHIEEIVDGSGRVRMILRTPDWEDFVYICFRFTRTGHTTRRSCCHVVTRRQPRLSIAALDAWHLAETAGCMAVPPYGICGQFVCPSQSRLLYLWQLLFTCATRSCDDASYWLSPVPASTAT